MQVGNFYYGQGHPMKPHRIRMTRESTIVVPERTDFVAQCGLVGLFAAILLRLTLVCCADNLLLNYGLYKKMEISLNTVVKSTTY